jgi:hypothetical protein
MRFLSHIRGFGVQIVEPRVHMTQYGDRVTDREGYVAQFLTGDVTEADVDFAERVFLKEGLLYGRTTELDEVTPTSLLSRLSVFDTAQRAADEKWTDDFRQTVEEKLTERADGHPDFRLITVEAIAAPWPRYLDFRGTLPQLIEKIVEDGYDVRQVLAFERQSGQRPEAIEALEKLLIEQEVSQTAEPQDQATVPA